MWDFESWLERDHAILLDHDPRVVGFASQPFWLFWWDGRRARSHAPDWFARLADGTGVVVDCRPDERVHRRDAEAFAATERACAVVGWQFRRVGAPDPRLMANLRWLAGYRYPRHYDPELAARLEAACTRPRPVLAVAAEVGDPLVVLPVLYHPAGPFTPTLAARPGELVQVDTTPLDVLAVLDDGVDGRVELTTAVDVATRTVCAGVLRPAGTKAVDAALLLA
jgi:hypothetical protein